MNTKLKIYAKRHVWYLIMAWMVILILSTILMALAFDDGYVELSYAISGATPFLMIFYGLVWWLGIKNGFEKENDKNKRRNI